MNKIVRFIIVFIFVYITVYSMGIVSNASITLKDWSEVSRVLVGIFAPITAFIFGILATIGGKNE